RKRRSGGNTEPSTKPSTPHNTTTSKAVDTLTRRIPTRGSASALCGIPTLYWPLVWWCQAACAAAIGLNGWRSARVPRQFGTEASSAEPRTKHGGTHHEHTGYAQRPCRLREAQRDQQQGRQDERRIGEHAQERNGAPLHADVPEEKGRAQRAQTQADQGGPRP